MMKHSTFIVLMLACITIACNNSSTTNSNSTDSANIHDSATAADQLYRIKL